MVNIFHFWKSSNKFLNVISLCDIEILKSYGATDAQIQAVKTEKDLENLYTQLLNARRKAWMSGDDGGSTGDSDDSTYDPWSESTEGMAFPELNPGDGSLPGSM